MAMALLSSGQGAWAGGKMIWRKSLPAAQAEARQSHKLVMLEFTTVSCGYCKKMDAETYSDPKVIRLVDSVVPVKIDAEHEGQRLAMKYRIEGFPTILFLNENGGVEGLIGGFLPAFGFARSFSSMMKRHQEFVATRNRFQKNRSDVQAAFDLEEFYATQGNGARTLAMQRQVERLDPKNAKGMLARSCLYLGDFYSMQGHFDKSAPLYRQAIHVAKTPLDKAYGHLSLAYCSLSGKRFPQALQELKVTQSVPNCPPKVKGAAQQLINSLHEQGIR